MDRLGARRGRVHVGGGVHEVHARSDQISRIAYSHFSAHTLTVYQSHGGGSSRICVFRVFPPPMSDDPCRLTTNLDRRTDGNGARHVPSLARQIGAALVGRSPSTVRVMEHGALTAPRLRVGTGRGVVRSRSLTGARASQRLASGAPMMLTHASTNRACAWVPQQPSRLRLGARRSSAMEGLRLASCGAYGCGGRRLRGLTVRSHSGPHGTTPSPSTPRSHPPYPVNPGELRFASAIAPGRLFPAEAAPPPRLDPAPRPRSSRAIASITPPRASR